jgi:hypothetical protein
MGFIIPPRPLPQPWIRGLRGVFPLVQLSAMSPSIRLATQGASDESNADPQPFQELFPHTASPPPQKSDPVGPWPLLPGVKLASRATRHLLAEMRSMY